MADTIYETLEEGSFDGIVIPVVSVKLHTGTAKARHVYPFRPGVDIEHMSREGLAGTIVAVYVNGLEGVAATNDLWPGALTTLRNRVQEARSGPLVIPTLGRIPLASIDIDEDNTTEFVDGAHVTITFEEDSAAQFSNLKVDAPKGAVGSSASDADAALAAVTKDPFQPFTYDDGSTISSFANWTTNIIGQIDMLQDDLARPVQQIAAMVGAVDALLEELQEVASPSDWPLLNALRTLKANAQTLAETVTSSQEITGYTTGAPTNVTQVATATKNDVADVLALNPDIYDANAIDAGVTLTVLRKL